MLICLAGGRAGGVGGWEVWVGVGGGVPACPSRAALLPGQSQGDCFVGPNALPKRIRGAAPLPFPSPS